MTTPVYTETADNFKNVFNASDELRRIDAMLPGAGYVLLRRPGEPYQRKNRKTGAWETVTATGKEPILKDWQHTPATIDQAIAHANRGGNVGLLGGHNGYILLDADKLADERRNHPRLVTAVAVIRDNADDRAKWIVRIDGELPQSAKDHDAGLEILAAGNQGVIFGTHHTGARIEITGNTTPIYEAKDIASLWHDFTGKELGARADQVVGEPDADAVARSMALVDHVLTLADVAGDWREYQGTGRKIILDRCPFNPPDDPHADDEAAAVLVAADGSIAATCHHARCQQRIKAHGSGWGLLKEIAGYVPPENDVKRIVDNIRLWYRSVDLAEFVPILKQAENGYRTRANDTKTIEAFCKMMVAQNRFDVTAGYRTLATAMGCGVGSVKARVDRMAGWFIVPLENDGGAMTYALAATFGEMIEAWAAEYTEVAYIEHLFPWRKEGVQCTQLCISTHTADPAFAYSLTPITVDQVRSRWEESQEPDSEVKPYKRTKQLERRLAADLPSLGADAMLVVDALQRHGGTLEKRRLAELTFKSASAISRIVGRLVDADLADADHYTVTLNGDWSSHLAGIVGRMPTTPGIVARDVKYAEETIARIDFDVRNGIADADAATRRYKAANKRLTAALRKMAEAQLPELDADVVDLLPTVTEEPTKTGRSGWLRFDNKEIDRTLMTLAANLLAYCDETGRITDRNRMMADMRLAGWEDADIWAAMRPTMLQQARTLVQI